MVLITGTENILQIQSKYHEEILPNNENFDEWLFSMKNIICEYIHTQKVENSNKGNKWK